MTEFKFLKVILSYNRPVGLENLISSVHRYLPEGDMLVIDDSSTTPAVHRLLRDRRAAGELDFIERTDGPQAKGFRAEISARVSSHMNLARRHAIENGYDMVLFLQDDQQLLWRPPQVPNGIYRFLKDNPRCSCLEPLFFKRLKYVDRCVYAEGTDYYITKRGNTACSFFLVETLRQFEFRDSENQTSRLLLSRGYRAFAMKAPFVAFVPSSIELRPTRLLKRKFPVLLRNYADATFGSTDIPTPLLADLTEEQISELSSKGPSRPPFAEDYVRPNFRALFPFWYETHIVEAWAHCVWQTFLSELSSLRFPVPAGMAASVKDGIEILIRAEAAQRSKRRNAVQTPDEPVRASRRVERDPSTLLARIDDNWRNGIRGPTLMRLARAAMVLWVFAMTSGRRAAK